jgi:hypothetical protein
MTERKTNLAFIAVFSVLAVFFVAATLIVGAAVLFSGGGSFSRSALPASSYSLRQDH